MVERKHRSRVRGWLRRRRDRPGQSRAISTIFQLLPIKERAVSAQKLEMAIRFSTSETVPLLALRAALKQLCTRRVVTNAPQPASIHRTPSPFAQHPSKQGHLACNLASPKSPDRILRPTTPPSLNEAPDLPQDSAPPRP